MVTLCHVFVVYPVQERTDCNHGYDHHGEWGECFGAGELSIPVSRVATDSSTTAHCKHQACQIASIEQGHCANGFMMGSSTLSFVKNYCVRTSTVFLTGNVPFTVDCTITGNADMSGT
jgi:hypothetical protein